LSFGKVFGRRKRDIKNKKSNIKNQPPKHGGFFYFMIEIPLSAKELEKLGKIVVQQTEGLSLAQSLRYVMESAIDVYAVQRGITPPQIPDFLKMGQ
jgi:hypothetical protein